MKITPRTDGTGHVVSLEGGVLIKSSSHRATKDVQRILGYKPIGYRTPKPKPAATSYFILAPDEVAKVERVKGVSRARFHPAYEWYATGLSFSLSNPPPFPTPQELEAAGRKVTRYTDKQEFIKAGGNVFSTLTDDRFVVVAGTAGYGPDDVGGPVEAADAYADLLSEGWHVYIWDRRRNEGWRFEDVGKGWLGGKKAARTSERADRAREAINAHRKSYGQRGVPKDWSDEDVLIEAKRLGLAINPGEIRSVKNRLMAW